MTRTHRTNSATHAATHTTAPTDSTFESVPRSFGKHEDVREAKTKKSGAGKGNWGREGDEAQDLEDVHSSNPRRRSNSNGGNGETFMEKTKFEGRDDPVFEEDA